jgi:hypothetical protein
MELRTEHDLHASLAAASSADWSTRELAGRELAHWAHHPDAAAGLQRLLLDHHDSAVTDITAHALLERNDMHGVRIIARAIAAAEPERLDHFYSAVGQHLTPSGPVALFLELCHELDADPDPATQAGVTTLLTWVTPWA